MCCEGDTARRVRALGYKLTPQRLLVACVLRHDGGRLSAVQVLRLVRANCPTANASTVGRSLDLLCRLGLVAETYFGAGIVYEWLGDEARHYLACRTCGRLQPLPGTVVDEIAERLRDTHAFALDRRHLVLSGRCQACTAMLASAPIESKGD
jgi:Fe2+ or Zn2+ uptake regulation protein